MNRFNLGLTENRPFARASSELKKPDQLGIHNATVNIVVICLDTFRADIVGLGKNLSIVVTPVLNPLAAESDRFSHFTEPEPTVQVRNGCFTGVRGFPFPHGFCGWQEIPRDQRTVRFWSRTVMPPGGSPTRHICSNRT